MPIIQIPAVPPQSSYWTIERVVYAVRTVISKMDNTVIQNMNIRYHIASSLQNIAEMVSLHDSDAYGITWQGTLEGNAHPTGLPYISLTIPAVLATPLSHEITPPVPANLGGVSSLVVPHSLLWNINAITGSPPMNTGESTWQGLCKKVTLEQILNLKFTQNAAYRHSICWCKHGFDILFYLGYQIGNNNNEDYSHPDTFTLLAIRNPILDNMLPEADPNSSYLQMVDLPDRYVRLLVLQAAKACLMQIGEMVLPDMDSQIAQLTQMLLGVNKQAEQSIATKEYNMVPNDGYVMR